MLPRIADPGYAGKGGVLALLQPHFPKENSTPSAWKLGSAE